MRVAVRNEHGAKEHLAGRGIIGRQAVAVGKERDGKVRARPADRVHPFTERFGGKRLSHADLTTDNHDTATQAPV